MVKFFEVSKLVVGGGAIFFGGSHANAAIAQKNYLLKLSYITDGTLWEGFYGNVTATV